MKLKAIGAILPVLAIIILFPLGSNNFNHFVFGSDSHSHISRFLTCADCNGTGIETCAKCDGKGIVDCDYCKGEGDIKIICSNCSGSRTINNKPCPGCLGVGSILRKCEKCSGKGGFRCDDCSYSGVVSCIGCGGSGIVSEEDLK